MGFLTHHCTEAIRSAQRAPWTYIPIVFTASAWYVLKTISRKVFRDDFFKVIFIIFFKNIDRLCPGMDCDRLFSSGLLHAVKATKGSGKGPQASQSSESSLYILFNAVSVEVCP
jgi:hypothetical protein